MADLQNIIEEIVDRIKRTDSGTHHQIPVNIAVAPHRIIFAVNKNPAVIHDPPARFFRAERSFIFRARHQVKGFAVTGSTFADFRLITENQLQMVLQFTGGKFFNIVGIFRDHDRHLFPGGENFCTKNHYRQQECQQKFHFHNQISLSYSAQ